MPRLSFKAIAICVALCVPAAGEAGWRGLFDVEKRRAELGTSAMRPARAACLAVARDPTWADAEPVLALRTTDGYGTDRASLPFSWIMMVLSSRLSEAIPTRGPILRRSSSNGPAPAPSSSRKRCMTPITRSSARSCRRSSPTR